MFLDTSIHSVEEMTFDKLPFTARESTLGNNIPVKAYEFMLDKLVLGQKAIGFPYNIELERITVRLINANKPNFVVGCNVLKHLEVNYKPTENEHMYYYRLTQDGINSLQHDRDNHISNYYRHTFNYL